MSKSIIFRSINYDFFAISLFTSFWWFPGCIHSCLAIFQVLLSISIKQMSWIFIVQRWMICFKNVCSVISVVWVDKVVLSRWIIVLIMHPSLPSWCNLFDHSWESFSFISIFNPSSLILITMSKIFIISISKFIHSY